MIYGLENLNYAYKKGWAILTEGISDTWALRQFGFKNVFGNCGVEFSDFKKEQLSRLKCGLIQIPDRDKPGLKLLKQTNIDKKVSLFVPIRYKDAAETVENGVDMTGVLSQVGEWLESKGILLKNFAEEVSM
jgi:DNA primase